MDDRSTTVAIRLQIADDTLTVDLSDGRTIAAPLAWFPRLAQGSREERSQFQFIGGGSGMHWPMLDEDISVANLLAGQSSTESQASFKKWQANRDDRRS